MVIDWKPFYFSGNAWFGVVDSLEAWQGVLDTYDKHNNLGKDHLHKACMLAENGEMPHFAYGVAGGITLKEWAQKNNNMIL